MLLPLFFLIQLCLLYLILRKFNLLENNYDSNYDIQITNLYNSLSLKSKDDVLIFANTFDLLMMYSYDSHIWEKAYAINMGCSDDCFEYFRSWIIAQGKDKFYNTLHNPNFLQYFAKKEILQNYEGIQYVAYEIADSKGFELSRHPAIPAYELKGNANLAFGFFKNLPLTLVTWFN